MTEQQVIERLAGRLGWISYLQDRNILASRDALAPVLEGLSEIDWRKLVDVVFDMWAATPTAPSAVRYILTLPPRDLAFAIAEALEETQL
jgi:hypothetical protein